MVVFVFCLACGIHQAPTHHVGVLARQALFMYLMNASAIGQVLDIISSWARAQSTDHH